MWQREWLTENYLCEVFELIYKYGIGEHVYIVENGMHIKEVVIVNISSGFYQVCFTDKRGSIKLRESRLYKTISEAATNNSAAKNELNKIQKKKLIVHPMIMNVDFINHKWTMI